jgi:hypothetical protein
MEMKSVISNFDLFFVKSLLLQKVLPGTRGTEVFPIADDTDI